MSEKNAVKKKSIQPKKVTKAQPPIREVQSPGPITIWTKKSGETLVLQTPPSSSDFWTITGDELLKRWGVESFIITQFILDYGLPVRDSITHQIFNIESHEKTTGNDLLETYFREGPFNRFLFRPSDIGAYEMHYMSVIEELKKRSAHIIGDGHSQDVDKKQPSVPDYIQQRRTGGVTEDVIATELYDRNGNFKLSYAQTAAALGLTAGLNKNQHEALKQRGKRLCEKGEAVLKK